jgi:type IV pilus assembly protein PilQ
MNYFKKWIYVLICLGLFWGQIDRLMGQSADRFVSLQVQLDSASAFIPGLDQPTNISMRGVSLAEYIRAIGVANQVNVYIEDTPGIILTNSLADEPVKSIFLFICRQFDYTFQLSGSIIIFSKYQKPIVEKKPPQPLGIQYQSGKLALDLKKDSLFSVIKQISKLTGKKIITTPEAEGLLTAFLPPTALDTALEALFWSNGFQINRRKKGYYVVRQAFPAGQPKSETKVLARPGTMGGNDFMVETYKDADDEYISLEAREADLQALIETIFSHLSANYIIYGHISGKVSMGAEITRLEDLLRYLLQGTDITYKRDGNLYLIGPRDLSGLNTTKIVRMKYRPTFQAIDLIPGSQSSVSTEDNGLNQNPFSTTNLSNATHQDSRGLNGSESNHRESAYQASHPPEIIRTEIDGVQIVDYPELNRVILKGPTDKVEELALFLEAIDQPVPMVRIKMMVVEVNKNRMISTGLRAGIQSPGDSAATHQEILPGVDYSLDGSELNAILSNVPVLSNIGSLSDNFYVQLKAQESRGNLKVRMEPVLSMLNGREASLTIGQTQYYLLETQTASNGAVNNFQQFTQRFERIDANISLKVKPFISEDEMVTLDVVPNFTTPVGSFDADVPPTIATRKFISTIRVRQGETVILGGLTQHENRENTRGLPLLSRIPILKWIFGNVDKTKAESSLLIYITPEIFYY